MGWIISTPTRIVNLSVVRINDLVRASNLHDCTVRWRTAGQRISLVLPQPLLALTATGEIAHTQIDRPYSLCLQYFLYQLTHFKNVETLNTETLDERRTKTRNIDQNRRQPRKKEMGQVCRVTTLSCNTLALDRLRAAQLFHQEKIRSGGLCV